ncbi:MAG: hypothetical protein ACJ8D5_03760, partial [Sphingomicrobium sp.]
ALHGGGDGPNIDSLVNSLPTQAEGQAQSALDALASHGAAAVSNVDTSVFAAFTGMAGHIMDATVHQDAAPAAV